MFRDEAYYLKKIHWWVRFMSIGMCIWASTEAIILVWEHWH